MNDLLREASEYCKQCGIYQEILSELKGSKEKRDEEMVRVWQSLEKKIGKWWFTGLVTILIFVLGLIGWGQRNINSMILQQTEKVAEIATLNKERKERFQGLEEGVKDLEEGLHEVKILIKTKKDPCDVGH